VQQPRRLEDDDDEEVLVENENENENKCHNQNEDKSKENHQNEKPQNNSSNSHSEGDTPEPTKERLDEDLAVEDSIELAGGATNPNPEDSDSANDFVGDFDFHDKVSSPLSLSLSLSNIRSDQEKLNTHNMCKM
jgi:hypothetical protein